MALADPSCYGAPVVPQPSSLPERLAVIGVGVLGILFALTAGAATAAVALRILLDALGSFAGLVTP